MAIRLTRDFCAARRLMVAAIVLVRAMLVVAGMIVFVMMRQTRKEKGR